MTPRIIVFCETCKVWFGESTELRYNSRAAGDCRNAGHSLYASGIGRLELPTIKRDWRRSTEQPDPTLF